MMAREYRKRPSEILFIDDEFTAYCFDEVAFYLLSQAIDKKGQINWNRIRFKSTQKSIRKDNNKGYIEFIKKHS